MIGRQMGRRGSRRWLWAVAGVVATAAVVAGVAYGPHVVRELDLFPVAQVEVVGTRFVEPYAVITAAGIDAGSSMFDDPHAWRAGVLALPLVADARIRRHLPSAVTIEVREVEPIALVADGDLRPVDATGRTVALDPAGATLDLPILVGGTITDGQLDGTAAPSALTLLGLMRDHHMALAERVSQVELLERGLRLVFRDDGPDALLPLDPTTDHLTQLRLTRADLAARGELERARHVDVRFRDQVVVSFLRKPVSRR